MKPLCVQCQVEMRVSKTGIYVFEMAKSVEGIYRIWQADAHKCDGCSHVVIFNYARQPIAEHFEDDFKQRVKTIMSTAMFVYAHEVQGGQIVTKEFEWKSF